MTTPRSDSRDGFRRVLQWSGATVSAWAISIGLVVLTAALTAWGLQVLASSKEDRNPVKRQDMVIDLGEPRPAAPAANARDEDLLPVVTQNPSWTVPPRAEFPQKARTAGVTEGVVALVCKSSAEGRLEDCVIHQETPGGAGFGEAALAAVGEARVSPKIVDGRPTPGVVAYTSRFRHD